MNVYDMDYLVMDCIRKEIKDLIENIQKENPRDRRLMELLKAEEYIRKAMMKGSIYK